MITMIIFVNLTIIMMHHDIKIMITMIIINITIIIYTTIILIMIRETVEHIRLALLVEDLAAQGERQIVATRYNMMIITMRTMMMPIMIVAMIVTLGMMMMMTLPVTI